MFDKLMVYLYMIVSFQGVTTLGNSEGHETKKISQPRFSHKNGTNLVRRLLKKGLFDI